MGKIGEKHWENVEPFLIEKTFGKKRSRVLANDKLVHNSWDVTVCSFSCGSCDHNLQINLKFCPEIAPMLYFQTKPQLWYFLEGL
jgi:hypothetical protein